MKVAITRCPNCGRAYTEEQIYQMNYRCTCGAAVVTNESRVIARVWFTLILTALVWLLVLFSQVPVPHPKRFGLLMTSVVVMYFIGGSVFERFIAKRYAFWLSAGIALILASVLKDWSTT